MTDISIDHKVKFYKTELLRGLEPCPKLQGSNLLSRLSKPLLYIVQMFNILSLLFMDVFFNKFMNIFNHL